MFNFSDYGFYTLYPATGFSEFVSGRIFFIHHAPRFQFYQLEVGENRE